MTDQDSEVCVISGTRRQIRELVDGSLEVRIHIDPPFKQDFHRLFPNIDTPCALAPLALDFEKLSKNPEEPKIGPLCRLACIWCRDEKFREWFTNRFDFMYPVRTEEEAADGLKELIGINSRKDLDYDPEAAKNFQNLIRTPYMAWVNKGST